MLHTVLTILDHDFVDALIYFVNVAIRCGLIAILLYEISGLRVNRARTLLYAVLMMLTICVPLLPFFRIPMVYEAISGHPLVTVIYILAQIRNPIWMLLCFFITVHVLKLPRQRVTNLLIVIFCGYQLQVCLAALIEIVFAVVLAGLELLPGAGTFDNFILLGTNVFEEAATVLNTLLLVFICHLIRRYIRANRNKVKMVAEEFHADKAKNLFVNFIQITALWLIMVAGMFAGNWDSQYAIIAQAGYAVAMVVIHALYIYLNYNLKLRNIQTNYLTQTNKMMLATIGDFQGIKHDFANILQTYDGYFELGDMERLREYHQELRGKTIATSERLDFQTAFQEKPAVLGLFSNAVRYAEEAGVQFDFTQAELLNDVQVREFDLCRVLGILLNNAIEHAAQTHQKDVSFSAQVQPGNTCMIMVSNSVDEKFNPANVFRDGYTTKGGHSGHGLAEVNKILAGYYGCTIMPNCTDEVFTMYLNVPLKLSASRAAQK